ncbi:MAG: acetoin utilization deacetylase AcuC-like enzyme [Bradyrhizobium sp.]|jgi:acetoin utilization deacetylase AcuC-like enzyme
MSTGFFSHSDCKRHDMGSWHPEAPARLQAIDDQLIASRISCLLEHHEAPLATIDMLSSVHTAEAIAMVVDHVPADDPDVDPYYPIDPDTSLNAHSMTAALRAAGAAVAATDAVMAGELDNAFCSIRPPGHHATPSAPMGFCLFNNVAIAARRAIEFHGLQRIAIIDFDVHHGNGTHDTFRDDPRVLMTSFYQEALYPFVEDSGSKPGLHNMVNVGVPAFSGGDIVRQVVTDKWLPALHAHQPQMIFISAGFDAHREDDLGQMGLLEDDYAWITKQVMLIAQQYAQGRIVSCLEGGYNLSALGRSVVAHLKVLAEID